MILCVPVALGPVATQLLPARLAAKRHATPRTAKRLRVGGPGVQPQLIERDALYQPSYLLVPVVPDGDGVPWPFLSSPSAHDDPSHEAGLRPTNAPENGDFFANRVHAICARHARIDEFDYVRVQIVNGGAHHVSDSKMLELCCYKNGLY